MARPSNWNTPTTAIRVPVHAVEQLLEIAKMLDKPEQPSFVQNPDPVRSVMITLQGGDPKTDIKEVITLPQSVLDEAEQILERLWVELDLDSLSRQQHMQLLVQLTQEVLGGDRNG